MGTDCLGAQTQCRRGLGCSIGAGDCTCMADPSLGAGPIGRWSSARRCPKVQQRQMLELRQVDPLVPFKPFQRQPGSRSGQAVLRLTIRRGQCGIGRLDTRC